MTQESFSLPWISLQDFLNKVSVPQDSKKYVTPNKVYDNENGRYKLLVVNGDWYHLPPSPYYTRFIPSGAVTELTDSVLRHFGTSCAAMSAVQDLFDNRCNTKPMFEKIKHRKFFYACLHVRANDVISKRHYAYAAQPEQIKRIVYSACPRGTKLYIMSDIHNPNYFDFLRDRYDVYTYHDFVELRQLVDRKDGIVDNGMLFMVEKNIMAHALVKIVAPQRSLYHLQSDLRYSIPDSFKNANNNTEKME